MPEDNSGVVYLLTNAAMPGLTKIGKATQEDIVNSMLGLFVPSLVTPLELLGENP